MEVLHRGQPVPKTSSLLKLNPMLENGVMRSNTRLRNADAISQDVKFPIILPKKNHVTNLVVKYHHESEHHEMGVNFTINHLREKYLVVHARQEVKRCVSSCAECSIRFRIRPKTDGTLAWYSSGNDRKTFRELCDPLRRSLFYKTRTGKSSS